MTTTTSSVETPIPAIKSVRLTKGIKTQVVDSLRKRLIDSLDFSPVKSKIFDVDSLDGKIVVSFRGEDNFFTTDEMIKNLQSILAGQLYMRQFGELLYQYLNSPADIRNICSCRTVFSLHINPKDTSQNARSLENMYGIRPELPEEVANKVLEVEPSSMQYIGIAKGGEEREQMFLPKLPYSKSDYLTVVEDEECAVQYQAARRELTKLVRKCNEIISKEVNTTVTSASEVLDSVSTTGRLLDILPGLFDYLPDHIKQPSNLNLPALVSDVASLNERISKL